MILENSNLIAVKNRIPTCHYPYGSLKYSVFDRNGQECELETTDKTFEEIKKEDKNIYLWRYYYLIGICNGTEFEANIICTKFNLEKYFTERDRMIKAIICGIATRGHVPKN